VGCDRRRKDGVLGKYTRKDNVFILLTLWVEDEDKIGGKVERGFVLFMNWMSSCKKHVKV
jgi:hypothetical protein